MAIFGDLQELPLGELLPVLARREGTLEVYNLPEHPPVTLYLKGGQIICGFIGGRPTPASELQTALFYLASARKGKFEFRPQAPSTPCPYPVALSLEGLLPSNPLLSARFPPPERRFQLKEGPRPEDYHLRAFLRKAEGLLLKGASARELGQALGIPLEHAQYYLYKLRQLGLLVPQEEKTPKRRPQANVASLIQALRSRLLGGES